MLWIILTLISALLFAGKDILAKKFMAKGDMHPLALVFQKYAIGFLLLLLLSIWFVDFTILFHLNLFILLVLKSISLLLAIGIYYTLMKKYEISLVTPLFALSPFVLLFLSMFMLHEELTVLQVIGIFVVIVGAYGLEFYAHGGGKKGFSLKKSVFSYLSLVAICIMLIAASFTAVFDRMILESVTVWNNLFYTTLFATTILAVYLFTKHDVKKYIMETIHHPKTLLFSLLTLLGDTFILSALAIPSAAVSLIIPLRRVSTLFSALFGGMLMHEKHLVRKGIFIIILLIGVVLITL